MATGIRDKVAIIGMGCTKFGERWESSAEDLFSQTHVTDIAQRELAEQVARALADLPAEQREVVELKTQGRLTFREIADVTGAPHGTLASRYRAALDNLRHRLVVG